LHVLPTERRNSMMRRFGAYGVLLLAGSLMFASGSAGADPQPTILGPEQGAKLVAAEEVAFEGNRVSGVIVNRGADPIRNVRLVIDHVYSWPNEYRPGPQSPSEAEDYVVEGEIPAGGQKAFSTTFRRPSPPATGGSFETRVYVVSFTQILPPRPAAVASPPSMP
jgi:hypothetical protein